MTSRFERLLILHEEGKITDEELDVQANKIFEQDDTLKQQFVERVQITLQHEAGVMSEERFDEIADQIEVTSPNYSATTASLRLLGKHFVASLGKSRPNNN